MEQSKIIHTLETYQAERRHGPYMGRKLKRAGIILDDPYDATGPNSDR